MAGLDSAPGLPAAALLELCVEVGAQLHATLYHPASGVVVEAAAVGFARLLWDSQR